MNRKQPKEIRGEQEYDGMDPDEENNDNTGEEDEDQDEEYEDEYDDGSDKTGPVETFIKPTEEKHTLMELLSPRKKNPPAKKKPSVTVKRAPSKKKPSHGHQREILLRALSEYVVSKDAAKKSNSKPIMEVKIFV